MPEAVIAGAGPVGSLSAILLAQSGFVVKVVSLFYPSKRIWTI